MDAALGWIGDLVAAFAQLLPRLIHVTASEMGVKFVKDDARVIEPGLHWWWPLTTKVEVVSVVRQSLTLESQTVVTKDGVTVAADGSIMYHVVDVHTYVVDSDDSDEVLTELGQVAKRRALGALTLEQINAGRAKLDNKLTHEAEKLMGKLCGVEIESMHIHSCAPGQVLIHTGGGLSSDA